MPLDERPEHDPDGVPHDIVLRVAFASCALAVFGVFALEHYGWAGGAAVALIAVPTMIIALDRRAMRERDDLESHSDD